MIALGSAYLHHAAGVDGAGFDAGGHGFALALHPVLAQSQRTATERILFWAIVSDVAEGRPMDSSEIAP